MLNVVCAKRGEEYRIGQIYDSARVFMRSYGLYQWQSDYPDVSDARSDIACGVSRVLKDGDEIVATAAFVDYEEDYLSVYDGAWLSEGEYLAVHRVAVDSSVHGKGYVGILFSAAEQEARAKGKKSLRIDTHEHNKPMRRALEKGGFVCIGKIRLKRDGAERVAYEKVL
ncbi:MAG: GNAT family N-acetyltransferase [Clostridia bacterium]|nr:GNAT family N-acetyltransferase [Clostridia bacterium]